MSVINPTLTVVILSKSNKIGKTNGNANIDIKVELLLSDADITDTKVNTMEIPKIPDMEPNTNKPTSLTGKPDKTPRNINIIMNTLQRKIKLYISFDMINSSGSKIV